MLIFVVSFYLILSHETFYILKTGSNIIFPKTFPRPETSVSFWIHNFRLTRGLATKSASISDLFLIFRQATLLL